MSVPKWTASVIVSTLPTNSFAHKISSFPSVIMTPTRLLAQLILLAPSLVNAIDFPVLPYDYTPASRRGPLNWRTVDVSGNEWEKYVGHDQIDLDVAGNECGSTRRPSPTNLIANKQCTDQHEILTRESRNTDCKIQDVTFYTTPHSLRADFPLDDSTCLRPTIDMPNGFPYRWLAHHMEVHLRAEHVLDGRRYDGEIQMYHLGQADQRRELAAVSVLLDASGLEDNAKLQEWIDRWEQALQEETTNCKQRNLRQEPKLKERTLKMVNYTITGTARTALEDVEHVNSRQLEEVAEIGYAPRRKMFPYDLWPTIFFYRYRGSITAPPCSEIVNWRVLDEPLVISRRQYKALAKLMAGHVDAETCKPYKRTSPTGENFRPLQVLNNAQQVVNHCTSEDFTYLLYPPNQQ
jgi:carbonic anhydrase